MFTFAHLNHAPEENDPTYIYSISPYILEKRESWEKEKFTRQKFKTKNIISLTGKLISDGSEIDLYAWLAYTSGLGLNSYLPVTVEDSKEDKRSFDFNLELSQEQGGGIAIVDTLGTYSPCDHHVTMYTKLIKNFAEKIGVDYDVLYEVVLVHELAHAVTHLAFDEDGKIWAWFGLAKTEAVELLAQLLPLIIFRECGMQPHLDAMEALSIHQSPIYNEYKKHKTASIADVRAIVKMERKRLEMSRTSDISFQVDYSAYSSWNEKVTHIFQDGRALKNYDFARTTFSVVSDLPYEEWPFTNEEFETLPNLMLPETFNELRKLGKFIMSLDEEEFLTEPNQALDVTTAILKITIDGFSRAFSTHYFSDRAWGKQQAAFERFVAFNSRAINEAIGG